MAMKEIDELDAGSDRVARLGTVPRINLPSGHRPRGRVDFHRIFVTDENHHLLSEYALSDDCPLEWNDFLRAIPLDGLKHAIPIYQGEYVYTPFFVGDLRFVVLTRGLPSIADRGFIGSLLAAARIHMGVPRTPPPPPEEATAPLE